MKKIITILTIALIALIAWDIHSCNKAAARDAEKDRIIQESIAKAVEAELIANIAIGQAEENGRKAEEYREKMEAAESDAAKKDALIAAERKKRKEAERERDIILADPPCKDFDPEKISLLNLSYKTEIGHLSGVIESKDKALSSCKSMAGKYQVEASEYKKAATSLQDAVDEYKFVIVPGLESKIKSHKRRKFWQKMRDYLVGIGIGAIGIAALK
jgi:hypothetical protein